MSFRDAIRADKINGYSFVMKPGDQRRRMIDLPGNPRAQDCDPDLCMLTIDLYRTVQDVRDTPRDGNDQDNVPAGSVDRAVAIVEWGAGRGKNKARVDFVHGQRISLAASTLRIDAEYIGKVGPPVELSASVMFGSIGANKAQYTDGTIPLLREVQSRFRPIPLFARRLTLVDNGSPSNYSVTFSPEPRPSPMQIVYPLVPAGIDTRTSQTAELTIPNGVDYYAITNNATGFDAIVYPVFRLFL